MHGLGWKSSISGSQIPELFRWGRTFQHQISEMAFVIRSVINNYLLLAWQSALEILIYPPCSC